jgi:hypothetical protein
VQGILQSEGSCQSEDSCQGTNVAKKRKLEKTSRLKVEAAKDGRKVLLDGPRTLVHVLSIIYQTHAKVTDLFCA